MMRPDPPPDVAPRALAARLARGEALLLLDVRESWERALCVLPLEPPALDLHVPMGSLATRLGELRAVAGDRPVIVYCHHGVRSRHVVDWLAAEGFGGLANLTGGIDAWSRLVDSTCPRY